MKTKKNTSFAKLFTPKSAQLAALQIIKYTQKTNDKDRLLDVDFKLGKGSGKIQSQDTNTWIKFDIALTSSIFAPILQRTEQIYEATDRVDLFDKWIKIVSLLLQTKYKQQFADKLRYQNFNNQATKQMMPIQKIQIKTLQLNEPTQFDYMITVHKQRAASEQNCSGLGNQIYKVCMQKSISPQQALQILRQTDERFKCVSSIQTKKYLFHVQVSLWADYSVIVPSVQPK